MTVFIDVYKRQNTDCAMTKRTIHIPNPYINESDLKSIKIPPIKNFI